MDFETFKAKRLAEKEWATINGFNEGNCEKNGEFKVFNAFSEQYDVFVDIGANNGSFLDRLNSKNSQTKKYVLAFEPNPGLKEALESKIERGKLVTIALSDTTGKAHFNIYSDDTSSSLHDRTDMMPHFTSDLQRIEVSIDTLDNYLPLIQKNLEKGLFIKIDVEGVEVPVMGGSLEVFKAIPTVFMMFEYSVAWSDGRHTVKNAFHLLDEAGFKMFRVTPLGLEALRFYAPEMDCNTYCNYFAVKGFDLETVLEKKTIAAMTHNQNDFYLF